MTDTVRRLAPGRLAFAGFCAAAILALRSSWQTSDALAYMMSAATGREMYHPHHLLYVPIVRLLFLGLGGVGIAVDAVLAAQVHNAILGVVAAITTFLVVRRWGGSQAGALLAALALLSSRGFWAYSTLADVYVPATACLAGVTLLLPRPGEAPLSGKTLAITLLFALGVLYHQTNVLMFVPLAWWYASLGSRRAWQALALVLVGAGVIVGGSYVLAYLYSDARAAMAEMGVPAASGFLEGFKRYCLSYSYHPNPQWGTFDNVGLLGLGRLVHSQAWNVVVFPEELKYRAAGIFAGLMAGVTGWHVRQVLWRRPRVRERTYLLLWLATYFAFFLWWLPSEREFFITPLLPLVLLCWLFLRDWSAILPGKARLLAALSGFVLALVAAANLAFVIVPAHRERGEAYEEAADIARIASKECVVYDSQGVIQSLRYYFGFSRVQELELPYLHALKNEPIPARFAATDAPCALVPAGYLRPEERIDLGGYDNPAGYLAFLKWAFEARAETSGAGLRYRDYEVVRDARGGPYLRFGSARREIGSFAQLLAKVDADVFGASSGRGGPLTNWWNATPGGKHPGTSRSPAASP